jgi:Flp pilus assembly protein TadD
MALLRLGDEAGALAAFEAAVGGRPALAQPRLNLAALLVARGERERALALVEEARHLEIDEQDAERIEALRARLR